MSGRHLRRGRGSARRAVLVGCVVLVVGAAVGAASSFLLEDRPGQPDADVGAGAALGSAMLDPEPGPITIALVGDVTADGPLADRLVDPAEDFVGPLADVLGEADLAVANVDAAIAEDVADAAGAATAPPAILDALAGAGVDVASVANEQGLDLGAEGLYQTLGADEGRGMVIGVGPDEASAYAPFVRQVGGHTVAVIAATQVLEPDRIASDTARLDQPGVASAKRVDRLVAEVESARAVADTVVVYLHWGAPGETCPSASQQELAAALVEAGADIVAGPGSGRVQGAGRAGRALVAYGLGRFLADDADEAESGVLLVQVDGRDVLGAEWVPARRTGGVPVPLEGEEAAAAVAEWERRRECTGLTP